MCNWLEFMHGSAPPTTPGSRDSLGMVEIIN
jgi:hypothetical protein